MPTNAKSRSLSRRTGVVLLLVGVLAGVTVGGGVGVIAASSTKTVTVCANRKTNVLRYAKNGKCVKKTERKVVLNQTGVAGTAGATGVKRDTGPAGASSPTGFTARSVCGANGTTLCEVGVQGPGGGTIVYVDLTNEMPGYDYLEVAPTDASSGAAWATATANCGTAFPLNDCRSNFVSTLGESFNFFAIGTGRAATAAIVARHNYGFVSKSSYAAGIADTYTTATASDWFLPSVGEAMLMYTNLRQVGVGGFASSDYWSSSEAAALFAWGQSFNFGSQSNVTKTFSLAVRPVRAF